MFCQPEVAAGPLPTANTKPSTAPAPSEADSLFLSGQFAEAAKKYETLLAADGNSVPARVGLIRSYLKAEMVKEAFDSATAALAAKPDVGAIHAAMGEVQFRRGEIAAAEKEFLESRKTEPRNVQALLGLAKIYDSISLHKREFEMIEAAHNFAPNDPEVRREWLSTLLPKRRAKELEDYLATAKPDDLVGTVKMQRTLERLKALNNFPKHRCELVTKVDSTETNLVPLMYDPKYVRGWGLEVVVNSRKTKLLLDTGASGITISRIQAEKAGVTKIFESQSTGIGDKGAVGGYTAYAQSIRIGELEFHDCIVDVIDKRNVADEDGLVGADVFGSYLVDIDYPGRKLKLSPLPKRPDESAARVATLDTTGDEVKGEEAEGTDKQVERYVPQDRYIAPEMKTWSTVFRFGHMLLLPTKVNGQPPKLFLIDTGAFSNTLSTNFAREVAKVSRDEYMHVKGISGSVKEVFQTNKAMLEFAHLRQQNEEVTTFDLSNISRNTGTEVSGILGFGMMFMLEVKIDYRDGLVDFVYDAKRSHTEYWRTK